MRKFKNAVVFYSLFAAALFLLPACANRHSKDAQDESEKPDPNKKPQLGNVSNFSSDKIRETAEKYIDNVLNGLKDDNRALFVSDMIDEMKTETTKERFSALAQKIKDDRGTYVSREFLAILYQGPFVKCIWKAKFEKTPPKNETPEQKAAREKLGTDSLLHLLLGEVDGKLMVFGFQFN